MSVVLEYLKNKFFAGASVFLWYCLGDYLYYANNYSFKIARNLVSALHALSSILLYSINMNILFMYYISRGYYAIDTVYEVIDVKNGPSFRLYQLGMLVHHLVTFYSLQFLLNPAASHYVSKTFFLAEVSNLPLYLMKHMRLKGYTNKYLMNGIIGLELVAYIVLRMIMCLPIIYQVILNPNVPLQLKPMTAIMYVISGVWTYKLFTQMQVTDNKKILNEKKDVVVPNDKDTITIKI